MMVTVALEHHRALEKQYDRAVTAIEELMRRPMDGCRMCAHEKTCSKNAAECVPLWKGRREV